MHDNSQAISEALEADRRRLAARLRESLINPMSLIQAQVHAYEMSAGGQERIAFSVLDSLVRQALQQAYDFEASLNPSALETLGLLAALESLASQERRNSGENGAKYSGHYSADAFGGWQAQNCDDCRSGWLQKQCHRATGHRAF
jgi:signal transduction histidine kinase